MKRVLTALFISVLAITMVRAHPAYADWWVGNSQTSAYGIMADISTPSSAPYLEESGESNWVSTDGPYWLQAGWRYYDGYSNARPYVEYNTAGDYDLTEYGTQSWDTSKNYMVYAGLVNDWGAAIDYVFKQGIDDIGDPPRGVIAYSEVHESSNNELDTWFEDVYWKSSGSTWYVFNQDNFRDDEPYAVQEVQYYEYRTYGP